MKGSLRHSIFPGRLLPAAGWLAPPKAGKPCSKFCGSGGSRNQSEGGMVEF
jgi:hypothetical protein